MKHSLIAFLVSQAFSATSMSKSLGPLEPPKGRGAVLILFKHLLYGTSVCGPPKIRKMVYVCTGLQEGLTELQNWCAVLCLKSNSIHDLILNCELLGAFVQWQVRIFTMMNNLLKIHYISQLSVCFSILFCFVLITCYKEFLNSCAKEFVLRFRFWKVSRVQECQMYTEALYKPDV